MSKIHFLMMLYSGMILMVMGMEIMLEVLHLMPVLANGVIQLKEIG